MHAFQFIKNNIRRIIGLAQVARVRAHDCVDLLNVCTYNSPHASRFWIFGTVCKRMIEMTRVAGPDGAKTAPLSVRVTPKMKFGLEIMSRLHHYTIPEIVTRAIQDVFDSEHEGLSDLNGKSGARRYLLDTLWSNSPSEVLANLAFRAGNLMSAPEKRMWKLVVGEPKYWSDPSERTEPYLRTDVLAQDWEGIEAAGKGMATK